MDWIIIAIIFKYDYQRLFFLFELVLWSMYPLHKCIWRCVNNRRRWQNGMGKMGIWAHISIHLGETNPPKWVHRGLVESFTKVAQWTCWYIAGSIKWKVWPTKKINRFRYAGPYVVVLLSTYSDICWLRSLKTDELCPAPKVKIYVPP